MRLSAEAWLMLLALALYVYDSVRLLASNEAVLVRGWRGRWHAGFGVQRWKLGAKEPYLANLFTPHRPLFVLAWAFEEPARADASAAPLDVPKEIDRFGVFAWVSALCIFVLLPLGLFSTIGTAFTLSVVGLLYLNNLIALGWVYAQRAALHLSSAQWGSLAFECLSCPPFSINLVRRLCVRVPVGESFTAAARRLLPDDELAAVNRQCAARLEEQIDSAPEGSAQMHALQTAKAQFTEHIEEQA